MSKRDGGGAHAATLVFLLRSAVDTRAPLKRVRTEGPLYEMQQFEFTVTNPFPTGTVRQGCQQGLLARAGSMRAVPLSFVMFVWH